MSDQQLSQNIEQLLVARNLRDMQLARSALQPGYYLRAARLLYQCTGTVLIGTGFPVSRSFETDGPVGAMALYQSLSALGAHPIIACGAPLSQALSSEYRVLELKARDMQSARTEANEQLQTLQPQIVIAIEHPGLAADGRYYNMRREDITARCSFFDPFITQARCPTIAIGDGGNEIGMGNIVEALSALNISTSITRCDELLVSDVSNWGSYGLIAFLALWAQRDLLAEISPINLLNYLSARGSVDGVTRANTLTEDGLQAREGLQVIAQLRGLTGMSCETQS
ncbi:MAG: DUF4392 domain-containing protein [Halioglobus sp.]